MGLCIMLGKNVGREESRVEESRGGPREGSDLSPQKGSQGRGGVAQAKGRALSGWWWWEAAPPQGDRQ